MRPRLLASVVATASLLALAPATALAGETFWFNTDGLGSAPDPSNGYIRAAVTVEFPTKKSFDVEGWVEDMCPGDGKGGYVWIRGPGSTRLGKDTDGCGNGKVHFDPAPEKFGNAVPGVTVWVCEQDANGDGIGNDYCQSHTFDNWRVD